MLPVVVACALGISAPAELVVNVDRVVHRIPKSLYGVFFEEINQAGDGGLVAQLLRNPNFEESMDGSSLGAGWSLGSRAQLERLREQPWGKGVVAVVAPGDSQATLENHGQFGRGFPVQTGIAYHLSVVARCSGVMAGAARAELVAADGKVLVAQDLKIVSKDWEMVRASMSPAQDSDGCRLRLVTGGGEFQIDGAWLTPREAVPGAFRPDLAGMVSDLHPAFVRFPGGCFVEGGDLLADAYRWKQTLGEPAKRKGHRNAIWGYWSTDLLGFHEYLLWCERLSADAMYVANCGLSHQEVVPMAELKSWVDECLDAIEYAIGPADSAWGKVRAAAGHPEPFKLKYIEIGNENGMFGNSFGGTKAQYAERYKVFYDAIKARYPQITTIANVRVDAPMEVVDDHFYMTPQWFWENMGKYDSHSRQGPKVYVGEYAVTQGCGQGNLAAALGEAAFMTGLERNSDCVVMSSYAPMFVHAEHRKWNPDIMVFDDTRSFGTPSYYVQQLFARNRPDVLVKTDVPLIEESHSLRGSIGLGTWRTHAEFTDISVVAAGSDQPVYQSKFANGHQGWRLDSGGWACSAGALQQLEDGEMNLAVLDVPELKNASDYTVSLKARKISGEEGFLIAFRATNRDNLIFWNIGGWNNRETAFEMVAGGSKSGMGPRIAGNVETGKWYDIRIEVSGKKMRGYLDGVLVQEVSERSSPVFAAVAGIDEGNSQVVVKAVNRSEQAQVVRLKLISNRSIESQARTWTLTSESMADENSFETPQKIAPRKGNADISSGEVVFPPRSLTVLRIGIAR